MVGVGSLLYVQCLYRVCGTAPRRNPEQVGQKTEGLADSSYSVCCDGGTHRCNDGQSPWWICSTLNRHTATLRRRLSGRQYVSRHQPGRGDGGRKVHRVTANSHWSLVGCLPKLTVSLLGLHLKPMTHSPDLVPTVGADLWTVCHTDLVPGFSGIRELNHIAQWIDVNNLQLNWRGYLSVMWCRFAYGPADATATHCLLLQ